MGIAMLCAASASADGSHIKGVTAIGEVFGDGAKTSAVALEYDAPVSAESLTPASYEVAGREISRVCTGKSADKCSAKEGGNFVIIELKTSVSLTRSLALTWRRRGTAHRIRPERRHLPQA